MISDIISDIVFKLCGIDSDQVQAFYKILNFLLFGPPNGVVIGSASPYFKGIFGVNDIDIHITGISTDILRVKCTNLAQKLGVIFDNLAFFTKNGKKVIDVICIPFPKGIVPDVVYICGIPTFKLKEIRKAYNNERDKDSDRKKDSEKKKYLDGLIQLTESELHEMFDIKDTLSKPKNADPGSPRTTPKRIRESPAPGSPRTPNRIRESPAPGSPRTPKRIRESPAPGSPRTPKRNCESPRTPKRNCESPRTPKKDTWFT